MIFNDRKLFRKQSEWFVFFCYVGYEAKVRDKLWERVHREKMDDKIFQLIILSQNGENTGQLLVEMIPDISAWHLIRSTGGVTGFVEDEAGPIPHDLFLTPKRK